MDAPNAPLVVGASLALLVGKRCQRVSREDALQYISGISVVHDISSPEESYYRPDILGKGIDKSAAMNGKWRGDISTDQFEMSIPELIERISRIMTIEPGDKIESSINGHHHLTSRLGESHT
jgi:5-oxopent-3-ene-1,2,5-tricarboxylate decarboxylase/2-hydroxyhepta-2,4-diene-1,7-dioate isomerase